MQSINETLNNLLWNNWTAVCTIYETRYDTRKQKHMAILRILLHLLRFYFFIKFLYFFSTSQNFAVHSISTSASSCGLNVTVLNDKVTGSPAVVFRLRQHRANHLPAFGRRMLFFGDSAKKKWTKKTRRWNGTRLANERKDFHCTKIYVHISNKRIVYNAISVASLLSLCHHFWFALD